MTDSARWNNPHRKLPLIRWGVQGFYLLFCLAIGYEFSLFVRQALAGGAITASRPPSVEAFLPISAFVALKKFALTGEWDAIHPAGLTILLSAIVLSLAARKSFCSWICPVGTLSRGLEWVGARTIWRKRKAEALLPKWVDYPLISLKYLLLAFFANAILLQMPLGAIEGFLQTTYNKAADAKMLIFFLDMSAFAAGVIVILALLSVVVKHFWCRFLCPYGALLGLASWFSPLFVRRNKVACVDCRACTKACPAEIRVHAKAMVLTPECTGCLSCVSACPVEGCLTVTKGAVPGKPHRLSPWIVPGVGLGLFLLLYAIAASTGHWQTRVPLEEIVEAYRTAPNVGHP